MKVIITEAAPVASAIARALNVTTNVAVPGVIYNNDIAVITVTPDFIRPFGLGVLPGKDALPIVPERYTYGIRHTLDENGRTESRPRTRPMPTILANLSVAAMR